MFGDNPQREPRLSPVYRMNYVIQMIDTEFLRVFPRGRNQPFSIDFNYRTHLTEPFYDIRFILRIIPVIFFFSFLLFHVLPFYGILSRRPIYIVLLPIDRSIIYIYLYVI